MGPVVGSGKSSFENYCFALNPIYVKIYSSIDGVKRIAQSCGWDGNKTDNDRIFLAELKQLLIKYNDYPARDVENFINITRCWMENRDLDPEKLVFFVDVREPSEIQKLVQRCGAETILVQRRTDEPDLSTGDCARDIYDFTYDIYIDNDGTLEDLEQKARYFMKEIGADKIV